MLQTNPAAWYDQPCMATAVPCISERRLATPPSSPSATDCTPAHASSPTQRNLPPNGNPACVLANMQDIAAEEEALLRPHTISYYAVDFPRLFDVVQLRLHHMRRVLKVAADATQYRLPCFINLLAVFHIHTSDAYRRPDGRQLCGAHQPSWWGAALPVSEPS
eukprot:353839-Chlamydomonas_euryale.AAC.1